MYCPECGNQVIDGANFCNKCGKKLPQPEVSAQPAVTAQPEIPVQAAEPAQPTADYQAQKNAIRQSEMQALYAAQNYFGQKLPQFQAYDNACARVNHYIRGAKSALIVWGGIVTGIALLLLAASELSSEVVVPAVVLFLFPGLLMIFGGIMMKVANKRNLARSKEEYARLSVELCYHYINYPNCPVGPEYANPYILQHLLNCLQSGRVNTIQESINLAINERQHRRIAEYLNTVVRNTADVNQQTRVTTFFTRGDILQ